MSAVRQSLLAMARAVAAQQASDVVPSPCVSVCQMDDPSGLCQGCWRTLDEIAAWGNASARAQRQVWQRIEARLLEPSA